MRVLAFFLATLMVVSTVATASAQTVTVFAAASLQDALNVVGRQFTDETKLPVRFSYAASSTLAKQIEQGAPADVFASADLDWMDYLAQRHLIADASRENLLGNDLVLIAPAGASVSAVALTTAGLTGALAGGKLATGIVDAVPAGRYAKTALTALGLWTTVEPALAQADSVRVALALVSRGEANLGIVYATDAAADPGVKVVAVFPAGSHPPVVYPVALTAGATGDAPAKFLAYLTSPTATAVFARMGFTRPTAKAPTH